MKEITLLLLLSMAKAGFCMQSAAPSLDFYSVIYDETNRVNVYVKKKQHYVYSKGDSGVPAGVPLFFGNKQFILRELVLKKGEIGIPAHPFTRLEHIVLKLPNQWIDNNQTIGIKFNVSTVALRDEESLYVLDVEQERLQKIAGIYLLVENAKN